MLQNLITKLSDSSVLIVLILVLFVFCLIQTIRLHIRNSKIRSDAIKRSKAVIGGQVVEQIAPFLPEFPCSAADARFIGKPVDFIAFAGLSEHDYVDEVLLIEVKTGKSMLNSHEKGIKEAIQNGRIRYIEYRPDGFRKSNS